MLPGRGTRRSRKGFSALAGVGGLPSGYLRTARVTWDMAAHKGGIMVLVVRGQEEFSMGLVKSQAQAQT